MSETPTNKPTQDLETLFEPACRCSLSEVEVQGKLEKVVTKSDAEKEAKEAVMQKRSSRGGRRDLDFGFF